MILVQICIDFRFDSTGCNALTAETKLVSIENIKNAMDCNFDKTSCTLKEDELLTSTGVRDLVNADELASFEYFMKALEGLTADELASIEYFMKELEGFDKTSGTQGNLLWSFDDKTIKRLIISTCLLMFHSR